MKFRMPSEGRLGGRGGDPLPRRPLSPAEADARMLAEVRNRGQFARYGLVAFLAVIAARASWLMLVPDERLEERSRDQFQSAVEMRGPRGALLDRTGRVLAYTVNLPALFLNPSRLAKLQEDGSLTEAQWNERVAAIAAATGRPEAWILERLATRNEQGNRLQKVRIAGSLDPAASKALRDGLPRDAIWVEDEPVRVYPGKELAAPLVGFTDAKDDGAAGVEKVLQHELAGDTYRVLQARDRKGRTVEAGVDDGRLRRGGRSVRLTIDAAIQRATEGALEHAIEASKPEAAWAVVMDVDTGGILALASLPSGNPNDGAARATQELFKNRAAMDQIEPGSVMKPFVAAAAIEEGLVTPSTIIDCELGRWPVGDKVIKDDHPKGAISVTEVIKYSSNIGTAKMGFLLGAVRTFDYLKAFGFSRSTGLGLPGEVAGMMRKAANARPIELATTSFGQGVTASAVQLASAMATLANGGMRMQPSLVDAVLDRDGAVETQREARTERRVVSEETARTVNRMMETVVEEGGTGTRAAVKGYRVAGKTGTAQKVENGGYSATKRIGSFVGFLPADRPEIVIVVSVDTPTVGSKYGGIVAAPAFSEIGSFAMRYLGVPPDPPGSTPERAPGMPEPTEDAAVASVTEEPPVEVDPEDALLARSSDPLPPMELEADEQGRWVLPDLHGRTLRDALTGLAPAGFDVQVAGFGRVAEQAPAPGTPVEAGSPVRIRLN